VSAQKDIIPIVSSSRPAPRPLLRYQAALERCVEKLRTTMPIIGLRNPKIGLIDNSWDYCSDIDWVMGFHSGQLWLALQLTGDPVFMNAARARRPAFRSILKDRRARDHDLGFQFSLSCVADWTMTADPEARDMALRAAEALASRFHDAGNYIQAWNSSTRPGVEHARFVAGRAIVDCMQNLALLHWAFQQTAVEDFRTIAQKHAETTARYLIRADDTSFHTFVFDPASGEPLRGETHQGYRHDSCWSRGQAWMIHGYAQCAATTGSATDLAIAKRLAAKAEALMGDDKVPIWDFSVTDSALAYRDSSAAAVMAAGVYLIAAQVPGEEAQRWTALGDRLLNGLLETCDLTADPKALGMLAHGASHVPRGLNDTMLPYGDYYFMEALMRALGHRHFFW
jgi:unsaturated chondroitin disaccharide hydrolase